MKESKTGISSVKKNLCGNELGVPCSCDPTISINNSRLGGDILVAMNFVLARLGLTLSIDLFF